ncbi:Cof-type HAD-IIB family hydrolase [Weissella muntiaci]|uniref:Cof-type HAD-IIB family hydrolase n=1 Tax=Weissella muntiaci TaxID=2508881 RepID=A0A6C2CBL0_9LACO|nr:Cof-type HAD-IIB family hydrolase [Weissella muntiaci]TYC50992.1 Cof-type HAD-IIB family hydrolase [Weissella muntiaci]
MENVKIVATDLDGTFFDSQRQVNQEKFAYILTRFDEQNRHMVIATGNDKPRVDSFFEPFVGRFDYVINNGAQVFTREQTLLNMFHFNHAQLRFLTKYLDAKDYQWRIGVIYNGVNDSYMLKAQQNQGDLYEDSLWYFPNLKHIQTIDEIPDNETIIKLTFALPLADVQSLMREMTTNYSDKFHITTSGYGSVDIMPAGANKASGLEVLLNHYQVTASQLMTFGDGLNDLEMLNLAKYPYVMPNGDEFLLNSFPHAHANNDHDGVLDTIINTLQL